jgi:aerobic carbon-monoxide dehydrogenase small subunit
LGGLNVSNIKLTVNGKPISTEVEDRTLLVHLLRDHLGLTGTHIGCDTSQCGACTVHIDGRSVKSCTVLVGQANGSSVTTIEGIAKGDELHPMQAAFRDNHGLQCGYCTPGMIMASIDIVNRHGPDLDEATLRQELEGNICRCTGYHNIVKSVLDAAGRMKVAQAAE